LHQFPVPVAPALTPTAFRFLSLNLGVETTIRSQPIAAVARYRRRNEIENLADCVRRQPIPRF